MWAVPGSRHRVVRIVIALVVGVQLDLAIVEVAVDDRHVRPGGVVLRDHEMCYYLPSHQSQTRPTLVFYTGSSP